MSVQAYTCMRAGAAKLGEAGVGKYSGTLKWASRGAVAMSALAAASFIHTPQASAVPSFARQTGQPCATCRAAFLELTPFGREFKLMGYTAGGTRCNDGSAKSDETQVPLAIMAIPATYTHTKNNDNYSTFGGGLPSVANDQWAPAQYSLFVAGQMYCDVGAFSQVTYDPLGKSFTWDNVDIRYAKTVKMGGSTVVFGLTAHNNPGVQDVWNTSPAWKFPYVDTGVGPGGGGAPRGTMLGSGAYAQTVTGVGGYVWSRDARRTRLLASKENLR